MIFLSARFQERQTIKQKLQSTVEIINPSVHQDDGEASRFEPASQRPMSWSGPESERRNTGMLVVSLPLATSISRLGHQQGEHHLSPFDWRLSSLREPSSDTHKSVSRVFHFGSRDSDFSLSRDFIPMRKWTPDDFSAGLNSCACLEADHKPAIETALSTVLTISTLAGFHDSYVLSCGSCCLYHMVQVSRGEGWR